MSEQLTLVSPEATTAIGRQLAAVILDARPSAVCIYLHGDLGAGKTTFARGFLRGCGHAGRVPSPTYTLVEPYDCASYKVFHMDLYRLQDGGELEFLGIREMLEPGSILLTEWPERGAGGLPSADLEVFLKVIPEGRGCTLRSASPVGDLILGALARLATL